MRTLSIGCAFAVLLLSLAACGGSGASSTSEVTLQRQADLYAIGEIEKDFHRATSTKDIALMMSLWAPNATFTIGPGRTVTGKDAIRRFWLTDSVAFKPETNWISDTAAYKTRITANGDKGTLYFECHYVDVKTRKVEAVTAADQEVARINGKWLITNMVGGSPTLSI